MVDELMNKKRRDFLRASGQIVAGVVGGRRHSIGSSRRQSKSPP